MTKSTELKGSTFTLSVLHLMDDSFEPARKMLSERKNLAPAFFDSAPIVVDISHLKTLPDFKAMREMINETGMIMVAITGSKDKTFRDAAKKAGLAYVSSSNKEKIASGPTHSPTKIISGPIRSGQQIYAKNSDLIILSHVSAGAEIIADGNIHIYGSLRGRAIAGANGQKDSYVFCQNLQPELVSIAGTYWLSEAIPEPYLGGSAKVSLHNDALHIEPLTV